MECKTDSGNTLILCHETLYNKRISDKRLLDDCFIEVDWEGNIVWKWNINEHFNELGFSEVAKNALFRNPNQHFVNDGELADWMHINSMSLLGPNKWYDAGDERFHPDNIIWDAREANILAIISKETGKVVWKLGPDYNETKESRRIGVIIGQHHAHMIPRGLPGEGNILVYDNGGWAGYGVPNQFSAGEKASRRDHTRILEINPVTMKIVWQHTPSEAGHLQPFHSHYFYSPFISSAQRLPNGNTLITEGSGGRLMEVTKDHELVWEYISPYWGKSFRLNMIYRAYRYPYDYVPQLPTPTEVAIVPPDNDDFRLPGAAPKDILDEVTVTVEGTTGYGDVDGFCVKTEDETPVVADDDDEDGIAGQVKL